MSTNMPIALPQGFSAHVTNLGIKDSSDDLVIISAASPIAASGVFTKSRFAGPSVLISRDHLTNGSAQAFVIISKNANVANGSQGVDDAHEVVGLVARHLDCDPTDVLIASTGVIGRPYPMEQIRGGFERIGTGAGGATLADVARGMMTTDTVPKIAAATIAGSTALVTGAAKGVGMIEPDMATMIATVLTDADMPADRLDDIFRRVVDRTFNCVSVDSDTSTSDTAVLLASGAAGIVDELAFEDALEQVCRSLTKQIAADGEGAETLIEVRVDGARDHGQAKRVAKSIVNSPLVKTAVHGADPNWGRVAMAIGKCSDDTDIDEQRVVIRFGDRELFPRQVGERELAELSDYLKGDEVLIHVSLNIGAGESTVWGCDLTDGYVRINADYTT